MWKDYIITDESILAGKPIIKGTRLSVDFILDLLANSWSNDEILGNYKQLTLEHIHACLKYASQIIKEEKVVLTNQ